MASQSGESKIYDWHCLGHDRDVCFGESTRIANARGEYPRDHYDRDVYFELGYRKFVCGRSKNAQKFLYYNGISNDHGRGDACRWKLCFWRNVDFSLRLDVKNTTLDSRAHSFWKHCCFYIV